MNEISNEPKGIPAWLSILLTIGLILFGRALLGDLGMWLIIIASSSWVWLDAKKRDLTKLTGIAAIKKPFLWFIVCIMLFIVSFPVYLTKVFEIRQPVDHKIKLGIVGFTVVSFMFMAFVIGNDKLTLEPNSNDWTEDLKKYFLDNYDRFSCPHDFEEKNGLMSLSSPDITYEKVCRKANDILLVGSNKDKIITHIQHWILTKDINCSPDTLAAVFKLDVNKIKDSSAAFGPSYLSGGEKILIQNKGRIANLSSAFYCKQADKGNFVHMLIADDIQKQE